jgi:hypothetical protein
MRSCAALASTAFRRAWAYPDIGYESAIASRKIALVPFT